MAAVAAASGVVVRLLVARCRLRAASSSSLRGGGGVGGGVPSEEAAEQQQPPSPSALPSPKASTSCQTTPCDDTEREADLELLRAYVEGAESLADGPRLHNAVRHVACSSEANKNDVGVLLLHAAVSRSALDLVCLLLECGVSPHTPLKGRTPLHAACDKAAPATAVVDALLAHGADTNAVDARNACVTPLHLAVTHGSVPLVERLLAAKGADSNKENSCGWRPVHLAAATNNVEMLRLLHKADPSLDAAVANARGSTPLHLACTAQAHAASKYLLTQTNAGPAVTAGDYEKNTPLHLLLLSTVKHPSLNEAVELLIQKGANVACPNARGRTPLHNALSRGHGKLSVLLLVTGADPMAVDDSKVSPVHLAASCGDRAMLAILLKHLAERVSAEAAQECLNRADERGRTPVHVAAASGHAGCIELLAQHGASMNTKDTTRATPLLTALHSDRRRASLTLVHCGASGDVSDGDGNTPLSLALYQGKEHSSLAEELVVKHKVPVNTCDTEVSSVVTPFLPPPPRRTHAYQPLPHPSAGPHPSALGCRDGRHQHMHAADRRGCERVRLHSRQAVDTAALGCGGG